MEKDRSFDQKERGVKKVKMVRDGVRLGMTDHLVLTWCPVKAEVMDNGIFEIATKLRLTIH